jgi:poly(A) polymerase
MKYVRKLVALHLRPIALATEEVTDSAVRRLIYEAGDDLEDLLLLCQADITSKNRKKVKRILKNYERVKQKVQEVEEKDRIRNFEPPVTGEDVMKAFDLPPCKKVGEIKNAVKDAVLEGTIPNDREAAWAYMLEKGKEFGLEVNSNSNSNSNSKG